MCRQVVSARGGILGESGENRGAAGGMLRGGTHRQVVLSPSKILPFFSQEGSV